MKQAIYVLGLLMLSTVSFQGYSQNQGAMRHDFVKRGNSVNELATGNYTVLSSTTSESGAKEIAAEIKKSGYRDIEVGYLTAKESWYVYVSSGNDVDKARATRDKYRQVEKFKDAWILTVHE